MSTGISDLYLLRDREGRCKKRIPPRQSSWSKPLWRFSNRKYLGSVSGIYP